MLQLRRFLAAYVFGLALILQAGFAQGTPTYLSSFPKKAFHKLITGTSTAGKTESSWRAENGLIVLEESSLMKLTLFKKPQEISTTMTAWTSQQMELQKLVFVMKTAEAEIKVEGNRVGTNLLLKVTQAGATQSKSLPIQEPLLVSSMIRPYVLMKGLKAKTLTAFLLEPSALTSVPLSIKVAPLGVDSWNVDVSYLSQNMVSQMKTNGEVTREIVDLAGMKIEATPISQSEYATLQVKESSSDLIEVARVAFPVISQPRTLLEFRARIAGIETAPFELSRHRQTFENGILRVKTEKLPTDTKPYQSLSGRKDLEKYLQGDSSIPVHDPIIQKKAREIVGTEMDLWKRANSVFRFVHDNVEKVPTVSVPNALEVLKTMKGDCNEHAVLFTALARAANIPARIVVGLVYGERFASSPAFYYHAWVEVFTGNDWISMDPTWNQIPADATHLAFVEGGLDRQVQVTSLMGKIKLSPVPAGF